MRLKKLAALLIAGTVAATSLAACGNKETSGGDQGTTKAPAASQQEQSSQESGAAEPAKDGEPDAVQELHLVYTDLKTLDVNDIRNANEFLVLSQVQEALFRTFTDEDGNDVLTEAGCESYTVSDDGLVYTFKIRDQKWSDGVEVTAGQYVDSVHRLLNPELAFSYAFMAYDIKNAEAYYSGEASIEDVGVKALDDKTLEFTLGRPTPFFLKKVANLCFCPIRLDVIEKGGETWAKDFTKQVYCGPFVISDRQLENNMTLVKNPEYWDAENVKLEKVTLTVIGEEATQSLLLESKELDVAQPTTEYINKWLQMADRGELVHLARYSPSVNYMCFNQHTGGSSGLMNNAKIRKALSLALDREEFIELVYDGIHVPAYGIIPGGLMVGDEEFRSYAEEPLKAEAEEYKNNPEKLQALFKEGLAEEGRDTDLSKVELTFISSGQTVQSKAEQEYFQQTWEKNLGIKINMNILADSSLFVAERNANRYDLVYMGWNGDYSDPMTFMELFNTGSGYAKFMGGYHNEEFDAMFDSLDTITDSKERAETYKKMEINLVQENAGVSPLYYKNEHFFVQPYVKNLGTPLFGSSMDFSRAYISGK